MARDGGGGGGHRRRARRLGGPPHVRTPSTVWGRPEWEEEGGGGGAPPLPKRGGEAKGIRHADAGYLSEAVVSPMEEWRSQWMLFSVAYTTSIPRKEKKRTGRDLHHHHDLPAPHDDDGPHHLHHHEKWKQKKS